MKKLTLLLFICWLALMGCSQEEKGFEPTNFTSKEEVSKREFEGDSLILGNPYSKESMQQALDNLKTNYDYSFFSEIDSFTVVGTHRYIKFTPQTETEEALLRKDSTLHLFDYRLDCEYKEGFLESRKPTNDSIPDYYTAVSNNRVLPNVPYQIISELYLPEQDPYFDDTINNNKYLITKTIATKTDFLNLLLGRFTPLPIKAN